MSRAVEVAEDNVKKGAKLFKARCYQCHTTEEGNNAKQRHLLCEILGSASGTFDSLMYCDFLPSCHRSKLRMSGGAPLLLLAILMMTMPVPAFAWSLAPRLSLPVRAHAPPLMLCNKPFAEPLVQVCVLLSEEGDDVAARGLAPAVEEDALALLQTASLANDHQLSLTLCDDQFIHDLNLRWRGVDRPTDVLSFPMEHEVLLGDLVISVDTAQRQADERGHGVRDEIRVLLVHGLLHLLGYDHEVDDVEYDQMAEAEQRLLGKLHWPGQGLIALSERDER